MLLRGFVYRLGVAIKEYGERTRKVWLIRVGLALRNACLR
jgi:hypothetical protein